jgi:hypothetical protein
MGYDDRISHDTFGYASNRMNPEQLRRAGIFINRKLKRGKAFEASKMHGLLVVSLDANEQFCSDHRCCEDCLTREMTCKDAQGHEVKKTQYYHKQVYAQLSGPNLSVILDMEPMRPGEEECAAALRLLGRIRRTYGARFIDGVSFDAWYAKGPFLRAIKKLGWFWVVVLKRQDMDVYQEARQLSQGQPPDAVFEDRQRKRQVQLWEVKDLEFSREYGPAVRVVRSEERWTEKRIRGGRKEQKPRCSQWVWATGAELDGYAAEVVYQAGHRRWGIENKAFNELTQGYHLEHCYHHDPTSMLVMMLILVFGFTLFTAFALHSQLVRLGELTLKALAHELDLALEQDLPWDQWFHSG